MAERRGAGRDWRSGAARHGGAGPGGPQRRRRRPQAAAAPRCGAARAPGLLGGRYRAAAGRPGGRAFPAMPGSALPWPCSALPSPARSGARQMGRAGPGLRDTTPTPHPPPRASRLRLVRLSGSGLATGLGKLSRASPHACSRERPPSLLECSTRGALPSSCSGSPASRGAGSPGPLCAHGTQEEFGAESGSGSAGARCCPQGTHNDAFSS